MVDKTINQKSNRAAKGRMRAKRLKDFWKRFIKNRPALGGLIVIVFFTFVALLSPIISPYDPFKMHFTDIFTPPSEDYILGTDQYGRDILSRIIWGTRVSLFVGIVSTGISAVIGITLGSISGYVGGRVDEIIMRFVDIFMMIPTFFLVLTVVALFGSSIWNVMAVLGFTGWPGISRLIRAEVLSIKEKEYIEAAKAVGLTDSYIIFNEILPNAIYPAIVTSSMRIAGAIMTESSLSFLGLGDPNHPSWGWMLNDALKSFRRAWWLSTFPGIVITVTIIAFNLVGDGLNDALNPQLKER